MIMLKLSEFSALVNFGGTELFYAIREGFAREFFDYEVLLDYYIFCVGIG